jgi:predicted enzyme related to lactoylglutathione lyase
MANANNGQFVWYELLTQDPKAAVAFYSAPSFLVSAAVESTSATWT